MRKAVHTTAFNIVLTVLLSLLVGVVACNQFGSVLSIILCAVCLLLLLHLIVSLRGGIWCADDSDDFAISAGLMPKRAYRLSDVEKVIRTPWLFIIVFKQGVLRFPSVGMTGFEAFIHIARVKEESRLH